MVHDQLPELESEAFKSILELHDELRADAFQVARGNKAARTRLRVKLSKMKNLCTQARKEIPPAK